MKRIKSPLKNQKGLTLIETLVSLAVLSIGLLGLIFLNEINRIGYKALTSDVRLGELVLDDVNEIKGLSRAQLPAQDKCKVKYYNHLGIFLSETTEIESTDSRCTGNNVTATGYQIAWKVFGPSTIEATFTPSATLKLPKYYDSVIRVEIVGWTRDVSRKGHNSQIGTEVYVR